MQSKNISEKLKAIIHNISKLPTLPVIVSQVTDLLYNPKTSVQKLAEVISSDQSLTAAVLKLANSAYYGYPRQISTVKHALVILGYNEIRNITFTVSVLRTFPWRKNSPLFNHRAFWVHCLGAAVAAKMLAKFFRYRISGKVFVAGLIHDIGKIILSQYAKDTLEKIMQEVALQNVSFYQAEKNILGTVTHTDVGSWLAQRWNLPSEIEEAIKFHHSPSRAKINPPLCCIVHLADVLVRLNSIGWSGDEKILSFHPDTRKILQTVRPDFNEFHIKYFKKVLNEEIKKAKPLFDLIDWS